MPKSKLADPLEREVEVRALPGAPLKPITFRLEPAPGMNAKAWEIMRRRVMVAVAKVIVGSGCEIDSADGDP